MVSKTLAMLAAAGAANAALPPIHVKGMKFFYENGTQFFMKGIAYQEEIGPSGEDSAGDSSNKDYKDPLINEKLCKRDVPLLKELGVNTIRTYAIDPKGDHTACMKLLDDAGIYVVSDLSQPNLSIERNQPKWDVPLYERYKGVVDELAQYSNVLGFFAGNEVSDAGNNTEASAYVKAALRDTKKHIANMNYTQSVGYASNDHPTIRDQIAEYFNCGEDEQATDFWGYNIYSWCGDSNMEDSGYADWVDYYKDYNVPVFFAEYGCNEGEKGAEGRIFTDTEALYSDEMTEVFSGGLVYMFHQEANDYGVVEVKNGKAEKMKNFEKLADAHAAADPKGVDEDDYEGGSGRDDCPPIDDVWKAHQRLPPTPDSDLCDCMVAAAECAPNKDLDEKDFGEIFDNMCGDDKELCAGINGNGTTGVYGAYSMCGNRAKLTYVMNKYYLDQDSADDACDHDGQASTKSADASSTCDEPLSSASSHNDEVATMTSAPESPESEDGGSGSDGDDDESAASMFGVGLYSAVAMAAGMAMMAL